MSHLMGELIETQNRSLEKKSIRDVLGLSDLKDVFMNLRNMITGETKKETEALKQTIHQPTHNHHENLTVPGRPSTRDNHIESLEDNFEKRFSAAMHEYNSTFSPKIFIVESGRTKEQQASYVASGASKTMDSKHLTGHAVDIGFEGKELYPQDEGIWKNLCDTMHKYGIVNGYYDLKRGFDKPHFQPVEKQQPSKGKSSEGYAIASNWKQNKETYRNVA